MIPRTLSTRLRESAKKYPVVAVTGPRQSGKTTLVRNVFSDLPYVSLEDLDNREFALKDPRGFLAAQRGPAIIDEIQRVPTLLSYMQTAVDQSGKQGMFIITGSNNLMLLEAVSQSLAGRVALLTLLPFSLQELDGGGKSPASLDDMLLKGFYPRIHDKDVPSAQWYSDYIATYVERDVRQIIKVADLDRFQRFLKMCASRSGQLLNLSSLGNDCGITHNTAKAWLSILQASYIVWLLRPHFRNFDKRLIKSPKLYFHDTGLLCCLLGIKKAQELAYHPQRGPIFETWVLNELLKGRFNKGLKENLYFWRDHVGHEIDFIIDDGGRLTPLEAKSGQTVNEDFFQGFAFWKKISKRDAGLGYLVYAGKDRQERSEGMVVGWRRFGLEVAGQLAGS